jgi:hypothetical protein
MSEKPVNPLDDSNGSSAMGTFDARNLSLLRRAQYSDLLRLASLAGEMRGPMPLP